ncbi:MAG: protein kinase, partial [Candidatus Hydrogenedentes bacterium]|nr:protein kinase [Candidatus Hydrogenedentota bacterium]
MLSNPGVEETPGRYTLHGEYARGGVGRVLLVHDEHLGRDVALKELLPLPAEAADSPTPIRISMSKLARFLQEARITGQLEHPSIVPVYELGRRRDGSLYYTMKLVRGKTLSHVLRDSPAIVDRLSMLPHFLDLCHAIAYAHSRGVLHRDIKPSNVMIGEFG